MEYTFSCYGHENITATHPTTLMFTKDDFVTSKGDCIVGCRCDFELKKLKNFLNESEGEEIVLRIEVNGLFEEIRGILNQGFLDEKEIVARKGDFSSERTLVIGANKSALDLPDAMKQALRKTHKADITIYTS